MYLLERFFEFILFLDIQFDLFLPDGFVGFSSVWVWVVGLVRWYEGFGLKTGHYVGTVLVRAVDVFENLLGGLGVKVGTHPRAAGVVHMTLQVVDASVKLLGG